MLLSNRWTEAQRRRTIIIIIIDQPNIGVHELAADANYFNTSSAIELLLAKLLLGQAATPN